MIGAVRFVKCQTVKAIGSPFIFYPVHCIRERPPDADSLETKSVIDRQAAPTRPGWSRVARFKSGLLGGGHTCTQEKSTVLTGRA